MLTQLAIQNFGLIERVDLEFDARLNILTGETGAGKSILIEALRIALGDRINTSQVRDPSQKCLIEAVFDLSQNNLSQNDLFADFLEEDDPSLIIQRVYSADGRGKIKINGQAVTLHQLKDLGNHLIDFHGPHDHQLLLSSDSHMSLLDQLVDFGPSWDEYQNVYQEYSQLLKKWESLQSLSANREREVDLLSHQIKELEQVTLSQDAYDDLQQQQIKADNAEKLIIQVNTLLQLLEGEPSGAGESVRKAFEPMRYLNDIDENTAPWMETLAQIQDMNDQLLAELREYAQGLDFEPRQAQQISDQCDIYEDILRKFGPALEDARRYYEKAKEKYDLLVNLEHNDEALRKELDKTRKAVLSSAQKLTAARKKEALCLKKTIEKELSELGIPHVFFEARLVKRDFNVYGQDEVTFYISPNKGEELKPLADIVSSGEAARVMLGLKKALIDVDPIPVLIFDEIDAQIGGRLGSVTGKKLREIAERRQVILITHLPQIASFSTRHFKVAKKVKGDRTVTTVDCLDKDARVKEIAKMMSGENESKISIQHARELLTKAKN